MRLLAEVIAERAGRRPDGPAVRTLAGAVMEVGFSVMFKVAEDPEADTVSLIDEGLAQLELSIRETESHETQGE